MDTLTGTVPGLRSQLVRGGVRFKSKELFPPLIDGTFKASFAVAENASFSY